MFANIQLALAIIFTLSVSAFCSLLEAFILSITTAEIEELKKQNSKKGELLEILKKRIDETSSAILTLNTIANTLGATLTGAISAKIFDATGVVIVTGGLVICILIFSEIIPKNVGVAYRRKLGHYLVHPLNIIGITMTPLTIVAKKIVKLFVKNNETNNEDKEQEIILLAEKHAKEGALSNEERTMILNALKLDDVKISELMTPRTVVFSIEEKQTLKELFEKDKVIPFGRIPIFNENIDHVVGIVRRRDILRAYAEGQDQLSVNSLMAEPIFIPENATAQDVLKVFLNKNQQLAIVVDEFGSTTGVITMEDTFEYILGREIYEDTDIAVDMRELAKTKASNSKEN